MLPPSLPSLPSAVPTETEPYTPKPTIKQAIAATTVATVHGAAAAMSQGMRAGQQDAYIVAVIKAVVEALFNRCKLLGVFDGNGERGEIASAFVRDAILPLLEQGVPPHEVFQRIAAAFQAQHPDIAADSGTTACIVLVDEENRTVTCLHVGDSAAFLVLPDGTVVDLTRNKHKPGEAAERARIEAAGGVVYSIHGTDRVDGTLAMSRCIGNTNIKGVTDEPDVTEESYPPDAILVVATDGLTDKVDGNQIAAMVKRVAARCEAKGAPPELTAKVMAMMLATEALNMGSRDNITVVACPLC